METTELKQDEQTVEVIEHRSVDTMRNAVISGQTRELLIMLAGLRDIENSFCNWKNKYGIVSDNDTDHFIQPSTYLCRKVLTFMRTSWKKPKNIMKV